MILSGKDASAKIRQDMKNEIDEYKSLHGTQPRLVIIQVGNDVSSKAYFDNKIK